MCGRNSPSCVSTFWPWLHPTGSGVRCSQSGWSAMAIGLQDYRLPSGEEKGQTLLHQVAKMAGDSWLPYKPSQPSNGCSLFQHVWKHDFIPPGKGGTSIPDEDRLPAAKLFYSPCDLAALAGAKRQSIGLGIKCISARPVTKTCPG